MKSEGLPLSAQVAVVTGASRGIGLAIAHCLGRLGARVAICGRDSARLSSAEKSLSEAGIDVLAIRSDVSREAEVSEMFRQITERLGEVEILVNNAGVGVFGPAHETSVADWDRVMDTNLKGAFLCSRAVAPAMIARGRGHIINISSLAGKNAFAGGGVYCASKWGLQGLTGCLAEDLRGHGIRVSVICPGSVDTEFSPHTGKSPEKMLRPDDVAHAVEMLVTQAPNSFISEILLRPTRKP